MRYLVLLYGDESTANQPGTPEFDAEMAAYGAFDELAGPAVIGGEALDGDAACRTVRATAGTGGAPTVTAGPYAESVEALGGFYVLDAPTLDDVLELAAQIPAASNGAVEVRPLVMWFDRTGELPAEPGAPRWLATIHGTEEEADVPGTGAWDEGAAEHGRFLDEAGAVVVAGGALHPTSTATTVRSVDGALHTTDGPFAEAIEVVGGLYVLRGSDDEVLAAAARLPVGPGGAVELRPVLDLGG